MAANFSGFNLGINLVPGTTAASVAGDIRFDSAASNALKYYDGITERTVANLAGTQTLTNKTLSGNTAVTLISGSGILTLNTTGTVTVPNGTDTLVAKTSTDTLTNKTLTSPTVNAGTFTGTLLFSGLTASRAVATDGSSNLTTIQYTNANTASTIVQRDGSGNFTATTITAAVTGTASGNTTYSANNHGVVISGSGNAMSVIAPDASTTKILTSGGASADPSWQPAPSAPTNSYWSGTISSAAAWTTTSTTYVAGTNSGGNALTTLVSNGLTVTAGGSNVCGITWTPSSSSAVYLVSASFCGRNNTAGDFANFRLYDAGNSIAIDENCCAEPPTSGQFPFKLSGIYAPGTGSAVTISVQLGVTGGGTAQINGPGFPLYFTIVQIK